MLYTEEYSVCCILKNTVYTVYCSIHCILYTLHSIRVYCILQYRVYAVYCSILQSRVYAVYCNVHCTLHAAVYTGDKLHMSSVTLRGPDDIHHRLDHP
jgi:hypothetical protein